MDSNNRNGISRLDLVIGLVVMALLGSICVPALHSTRQDSQSRQCTYNLRQLGLALENYQSTYQYYPSACQWEGAEIILDENQRPARNSDSVKSSRANWVQALLPFLGETSRYGEFDQRVSVTSASNQAARTRPFDRMVCPSDYFNSPSNQYVLEDSNGAKFYFARGNYAINGGPQTNAEEPGYLAFPFASGNVIVFNEARREFQWWGNGMAGFNKSFAPSDFANGKSTMVAVDEIRAGIVPEDPRGVWALGQIGSSVTWSHGINSDDFGPNNQIADSDDILEGKVIAAKYGVDRFLEEQMPFCAHCSYANQSTARSKHDGGVNVLMLDGAVRFVSDSISPSLWHVIHGRDTPASVLKDRFEDRLLGEYPIVPTKSASPTPIQTVSRVSTSASTEEVLVNSVGVQFKRIPAGEFIMGLPDKGSQFTYPSEAIPHHVTIRNPYYLGVVEVTQQEYQTVMKTNPSWHSATGGGAELVKGVDTSRFPVEQVSWNDAVEFCRRMSELADEKQARRTYRLPTEAEWEFACRSGSKEPYPLSPRWDSDDGKGEIAGRDPHPTDKTMPPSVVGSYPANPFGLHDMRGNVFEWCDDWFLREYYSISPREDPKGPESGYLKTVRGWDWTFIGTQCKDFLITSAPWQKNRYLGFRVVCEQE